MDLFGAPQVKNLFKSDSVKHDNNLFRLHHQVNYFVVLVGVLFIFGQNHFGSPIKCYKVSLDPFTENYCWFHGSGHLPPGLSKRVSGCVADQRQFGGEARGREQEGDKRHTRYYLWLPFTLGLCLAIIKAPRVIWKHVGERGVMRSILDNDSPKEMAQRINELRHDGSCRYFFSFLFCEVLNIVSIALCMATLDALLGGNFWDYGSKVHEFYSTSEDDRVSYALTNPMCNLFPTEVSCLITSAGINGELEYKNHLCMLNNNYFNQYYFFVLWIWWVILLTLSLVALVYRIIQLVVPSFSVLVLKSLMSDGHGMSQDRDSFFRKQKQWDAFLLMQVTNNLKTRRTIKQLLDEMVRQEIMKKTAKYDIEEGQEGLSLRSTKT